MNFYQVSAKQRAVNISQPWWWTRSGLQFDWIQNVDEESKVNNKDYNY